ncbi:glycosyltransferase family 4 protein [Formosa haliotis]|uniref:glycosyltransferase family 4 protein n=1 Tax=Formosa haliotis TaxID=1555194 RepID=UPI0008248E4A|nr:glycosyltransferase family 4 protein [Formosa haliotis]
MIIVHLSSSLAGGGAEQMVLQLAKQSNKSIRTIVFSLSHVDTLKHKFNENNIEVHFLNINSFKNKSLFKGLENLHQVIGNLKNVIFHCHQFHSVFLGVLYKIKYLNKIPIIFTIHTNEVASINRRSFLFLTKKIREVDIIFSDNSKKWYLKNNKIIPNGVDFKNLANKQPRTYETKETFNFLFLGRLNTPKNPLFLISSAEHLLKNDITNFLINIVGDGNMKTELLKRIDEKRLNKYFVFHGFQNKIQKYLSSAHCLILPSLWEGMPLVLIEAAANKLPIVTTPVGSIPDFLNDSNATVISLTKFNDALVYTVKNFEESMLKAEKLYLTSKNNFSIENVYDKHFELYKNVFKSKSDQ